MRVLDLFCGEGGAAMGYHQAGYHVTGVDLDPSKARRFPFDFVAADALAYVAEHGQEYDLIHASPPCQPHTALRHRTGKEYVDLVPATRAALEATGRPYIIENVPGAPLLDPVILCGSMFGLGTDSHLTGQWHQLRRHRLFESNLMLTPPRDCEHRGMPIGVHGGGPSLRRGLKGTAEESRRALGCPWMTRAGAAQAIPPAYTHHLGLQALIQLETA